MSRKVIIGIIVAVVAGICGGIYLYIDSTNIIPNEKKTAQILADVYLADALIQSKGNLHSTVIKSDRMTENAYHTVLKHYNLDKTTFDSIVNWYSSHPDKYAVVYEKVVNILSQREGIYSVLLSKRDSINKEIEHLNDSLRVTYLKKKTLHAPVESRDSVSKDLTFEYDLDSVTAGSLTLKMSYVFPRKNEAKKVQTQLMVEYNDTICDTLSTDLLVVHVQKKAQLDYTFRDTIPARKLKLSLMKSDEFKKITATLSDISVTYMPYDIRDSIKFDEILLTPIFTY